MHFAIHLAWNMGQLASISAVPLGMDFRATFKSSNWPPLPGTAFLAPPEAVAHAKAAPGFALSHLGKTVSI